MCQAWADFCQCQDKAFMAHQSSAKTFVKVVSECQGTNVRVCGVFGAVATNILQNSNVTMESNETKARTMVTAEDAAKQILDGIKEKFRVMIGKDSKIMDFLYRLNPKRAVGMITKQMKDLLK